jgi:hypothetical protein
MFDLDYATIRAKWDTYPTERARYASDETGWVARLDTQYVCIANVPLTKDMFCLDVYVCCVGQLSKPQRLGPLVQRLYSQSAGVRYQAPATMGELHARFHAFAEAIKEQDCIAEGTTVGYALVQGPATVDMVAVIEEAARGAGLVVTEVVVDEPREG